MTIFKRTNSLMVSLPLISIFVCIFLLSAEKSYAQSPGQSSNLDQTSEGIDPDTEKLKAIAARDAQITSLLAQAVELYKQKQLLEAIEMFNQVIRLDPQNSTAHFSLAIALEANNDLNQAITHYGIAQSLEPKNKEYQRADTNAKKQLSQRNQKQLDESKWHLLAGEAAEAFKRGRYEEALTAYKAIEKENQDLALPKYNIGTIYLMQKKPHEALSYYKAAHKLEPDNKQYSESFEKLQQSIQQTEAIEKKQKETAVRGNISSQKDSNRASHKIVKQDLITNCGLRVKSSKTGLYVEAILTGSRAAQVGLQPGDTISVIDGLKVKKPAQLEKMLGSKALGQRFQLLVLRRGQTGQILF